MRDGHDEARVVLADLGPVDLPQGGLIAVGALAGLEGEVMADGTQWWISTASETGVETRPDPAGWSAALLTAQRVTEWDEFEVAEILDEGRLSALLAAHRLEPGPPAPPARAIQVRGRVQEALVHVVRGDCPHAPGATIPAWRASLPAGTELLLVGFHAPGRAGELTHHGTEFHLHALWDAEAGRAARLAGHLDRFVLAPGSRVRIARR